MNSPTASPEQRLSLFDAICINVGIIIGAGIYQSASAIANNVDGPWQMLGLWVVGGVVALVGALCYGELATAFPQHGGEYVYLSRAFGRRCGFVFAWCEFWIIRPGNVGAMAFVFGTYAAPLMSLEDSTDNKMRLACRAIAVLTAINAVGVQLAKSAQNLLTVVKVLGLVAIFVVALCTTGKPLLPVVSENSPTTPPAASESPANNEATETTSSPPSSNTNYYLAMVLVLFAYGGWNEMAYVAAEVREPEKNLWRGLVLSLIVVTVVYALANLAFLKTLGFAGVRQSKTVADDLMAHAFGKAGRVFISLMICLSSLGAINGMTFTGARITYALGREHLAFAWFGHWNQRVGVPLRSLFVQAAATLGLVISFGRYPDGFERLVYFTAPVFWLFILLVGLCLFVLRWRGTTTEAPRVRPVWGYPVTPLLFCGFCGFMLYAGGTWAFHNRSSEGWWMCSLLLIGIALACSPLVGKTREAG